MPNICLCALLIKFLGIATNIKTVRKLVQDSDADGNGEIDFDEFLEMIARRGDGRALKELEKGGLAAWKACFKDDVQKKILEIEERERRERERQARIDTAMQTVRATLSQETVDFLAKKFVGM